MFEIRATLLGLAGRRAALMGDETVNAELRATVAELNKLVELGEGEDVTDAYLAKVQEANINLCIRTGSTRLAEIIFSLLHQTIRYARLGLATKERRAQSAQNWTRLLERIEAGDGDGAEETVRKMVNRSKDMAVSILLESKESG
ncbi:FCD domain-containing protein [Rhodobacteraceae bacterium D3-12]|nr:FCD domain-containing protein [Rhodobacteraceae bacterium D3-12]